MAKPAHIRFVGECPTCGQSYLTERVKALQAELDAEKRVSASEIEYLNSMNRIWKASGLMVIVIALLLRILHV